MKTPHYQEYIFLILYSVFHRYQILFPGLMAFLTMTCSIYYDDVFSWFELKNVPTFLTSSPIKFFNLLIMTANSLLLFWKWRIWSISPSFFRIYSSCYRTKTGPVQQSVCDTPPCHTNPLQIPPSLCHWASLPSSWAPQSLVLKPLVVTRSAEEASQT